MITEYSFSILSAIPAFFKNINNQLFIGDHNWLASQVVQSKPAIYCYNIDNNV